LRQTPADQYAPRALWAGDHSCKTATAAPELSDPNDWRNLSAEGIP
jgi:hypothetical protein